jgi:uncharacterized protein YbjQ (UPF0145 family)
MTNILVTTTPTVENRPVREYLGIVSGEAFARWWWLLVDSYDTEELDSGFADDDLARACWRDFKAELHKARDWAIHRMAKAAEELGANAVIGVRIDYKVIDIICKTIDIIHSREARAMILIATGTAVRL